MTSRNRARREARRPMLPRRTRAWAASVAMAVTLASPVIARAEDDGCDAATPFVIDGQRAFKQGAFDDAVASLKKALALCERPVLHYNLGRAEEGRGDAEAAIAAYEAYLRLSPDADDRGAVEGRIATMRGEIARREELAREAEARRQRERELKLERASLLEEQSAPAVTPWVLVGTGLAIVAVASALGVVARNAETDAAEAPDHRAGTKAVDRGQAFATAANVSFVVGGLAAAAGLTWGILDLTRDDGGATDLALQPSWHAGGASVTLVGSF